MENYDWRIALDKEDLFGRYPEDILGVHEWYTILEVVGGYLHINPSDNFSSKLDSTLSNAFSTFLASIQNIPRPKNSVCRVFISHQKVDVDYAEIIASYAVQEGFEYWLDVHDPLLKFKAIHAYPASVKAVLIAIIIEINLLNCTHICNVQTRNSVQSRWIPYEFGRAKSRYLKSSQAASWFVNGNNPPKPEYLLLGERLTSEGDVKNWLANELLSADCQNRKS